MRTLYIFVDESGNFDFTPNGSKYFILAALSTMQPFAFGSPLLQLRYDLLPNYACGQSIIDCGYFHASEDTQFVRDRVFDIVRRADHQARVDTVIAQKNKAMPDRYYSQPLELYRLMGESMLKYAFNRATWKGYDHVVLVFSSIFDKKKRGILKQVFKALIKKHAPNISFALYFHDSRFDVCNQAVDYFCWAVFRKWESSDPRSHAPVQHLIKSEFDIFARGMQEFYQYKK